MTRARAEGDARPDLRGERALPAIGLDLTRGIEGSGVRYVRTVGLQITKPTIMVHLI
jgi:hypothetical protein